MPTGIYARVYHDGWWQWVEIERLTDDEIAAYLDTKKAGELWTIAYALARWIRDHMEESP